MAEQWERQPAESYQAFAAFQNYLTTAERSYSKVAKALSKSTTLIKRWAKKYRWRERADAWDGELSKRAMEQAATDYAAMITRQINIGRMFQSRGANAIQAMDLANLPPKFLPALVALTQTGVKIERSARDLNRQNDTPQEDLFVSTLEKIWREESES